VLCVKTFGYLIVYCNDLSSIIPAISENPAKCIFFLISFIVHYQAAIDFGAIDQLKKFREGYWNEKYYFTFVPALVLWESDNREKTKN
jgi:hypothetical protein